MGTFSVMLKNSTPVTAYGSILISTFYFTEEEKKSKWTVFPESVLRGKTRSNHQQKFLSACRADSVFLGLIGAAYHSSV